MMRRPWPRRIAGGAIRAYQLSASALIGRHCRYLPTCSEYADLAIDRHGVWYGSWMALARICRCHPWGADGFDPPSETLPERISWYTAWRAGAWRAPMHCDAPDIPR